MKALDLHTLELKSDPGDPPGYEAAHCRLAPLIGAEMIGGTVYEIEPGNANCPYHYEWGNEEWLIVLDGTVTVRHPGGEEEVAAGGVVCFPDGPAGAHKLANRSGAPARFLVISTRNQPAAAVYPDSGKIGMWMRSEHPDNVMVRRESAVDYWDREA